MTSSLRLHLAHEASGLSSFELLVAIISEVRDRFLGRMLFATAGVSRCA